MARIAFPQLVLSYLSEVRPSCEADLATSSRLRAAVLEDPPLFSSQAAPPYGPGMMQTLGPMFAAWAKWLGKQWSIGHWDGMAKALPDELPAFLHPGIGFMLGDGPGSSASRPRRST